MPIVAIALGSNLSSSFGTPDATLREATRRLEALGHVLAISHLIETDPVDVVNQPRFTNAAALLDTALPPLDLLKDMQAIERDLGRVREGVVRKGPRTLDLDLLLYDDMVLNSGALTVPHPAMHEREFVLAPLAEIGGQLRHTVLNRSIAELLEDLRCRQHAHIR